MVQERLARRRFGSEVGQWAGWASWSACSRSCGGGIRTQSRHCLQRPAADNGTDRWARVGLRTGRQGAVLPRVGDNIGVSLMQLQRTHYALHDKIPLVQR